MTNISITVERCNSIEKATVSITEKALNIKFGANGAGKSTIARAISLQASEEKDLSSLTSFKYLSSGSEKAPKVSGSERIRTALTFNEQYVAQFVFQPEEILKNSFDVFVNTADYQAAIKEIENLLKGLKAAFEGSDDLRAAIKDLQDLRDALTVTTAGELSKASKAYKAFAAGNKIENIPDELTGYKDFIKSNEPASWITWQKKGNAFLDLSENCPFCAGSLKDPGQKDTIRLVEKEYDSKSVEHLSALRQIIDNLGKYFTDECKSTLEEIASSKINLKPEEINFLSTLGSDVSVLPGKLEGLQRISFYTLRDVEKIEDELGKLKIQLNLLPRLESDQTTAIVEPLNEQLQTILDSVGQLKGSVNKQKSKIAKLIQDNQADINSFLVSAGYRYNVIIIPEAETYKIKLVHIDSSKYVESATQHLSFGERNAFALILYMYHALRERPDLVILDDPVSSFDKTKKFAIFSRLFRGPESLRDQTVLLLTHDIEPIIDVLRSTPRLFQSPRPSATFLHCRGGNVQESAIEPGHLKTFPEICISNVGVIADPIIKSIYLRRSFEIVGERAEAYHILSSLLHGRAAPTNGGGDGAANLSAEERSRGETAIRSYYNEFDYDTALAEINNKKVMIDKFKESLVGYEKVQLFRVISEIHMEGKLKESDHVFQKFINESFHIENEYILQLNPQDFDMVPEHVIAECERILQESEGDGSALDDVGLT